MIQIIMKVFSFENPRVLLFFYLWIQFQIINEIDQQTKYI